MLADYALHDARAAGFDRALFVVRPEHEAAFREHHRRLWPGAPVIDYAHQPTGPTGALGAPRRTRPWGTGHAVLAAATALSGPFAVLNADDYYGPIAYERLGRFLRGPAGGGDAAPTTADPPPPRFALVGYRLARTLSGAAGVSRAVCRVDAGGRLLDLDEILDVRRGSGAITGRSAGSGAPCRLGPSDTVSMNIWGFTPELFPRLEAAFERFLADHGADPEAEFLLGPAVRELVARGEAEVRVLESPERAFGLTHATDREPVARALARIAAAGRYPALVTPG